MRRDLTLVLAFTGLVVGALVLGGGRRAEANADANSKSSAHATPSVELVRVDRSGLLYVPSGCDREPNVLYHFHGVPGVVVDQVERAGLDVVVRVTNEGTLSDDYTKAWSKPGAFERLMNDTRRRLETYCSHEVHLDRVALSSFSAGFAAVQQILSDTGGARRIDGVLLEDSLYAGYSNPKEKVLSRRGLAPFLSFARAALGGDKLMAITHSDIRTPDYASTRETADYLLRELGLVRKPSASGEGSEVSAGNFWVRGLPGRDAEAHAWHLQQMGRTVLVRLARFWRTRVLPRGSL